MYKFVKMLASILIFGSIYYIVLKIIRFLILDHLNLRLQVQSIVEIFSLFVIAIASLILTVTMLRYLLRQNRNN
ncbi:putative membrane protein [Bacillus sp. 3255]|nr:putative membrane protein [Bacillus sp. 3255]